jgi:hypothetical protein
MTEIIILSDLHSAEGNLRKLTHTVKHAELISAVVRGRETRCSPYTKN